MVQEDVAGRSRLNPDCQPGPESVRLGVGPGRWALAPSLATLNAPRRLGTLLGALDGFSNSSTTQIMKTEAHETC